MAAAPGENLRRLMKLAAAAAAAQTRVTIRSSILHGEEQICRTCRPF